MARVRTGQGQLAEAGALLDEARAAWRGVETTYGQPFDAYLRYYQGSVALVQGDADAARALFERSLRDLEAARDDLRGVVLGSLGLLAARRGEHGAARARFAEGLPLLRGGLDQWDLALLLLNSGLEEALAASPAAGSLLVEALRAWRQLGSTSGVALSLAGLGDVAASRGASDHAGQLFGAGRALLPASDPLLAVVVPYDLPARLAAIRTDGDPAAFDRGLRDGQDWTIDQAVAAGEAIDQAVAVDKADATLEPPDPAHLAVARRTRTSAAGGGPGRAGRRRGDGVWFADLAPLQDPGHDPSDPGRLDHAYLPAVALCRVSQAASAETRPHPLLHDRVELR
jgi:tetratricopeptide (TPR) repeat protein